MSISNSISFSKAAAVCYAMNGILIDIKTLEKPQQSFSFDTNVEPQTEQSVARTRYKLPDINYLNKNF